MPDEFDSVEYPLPGRHIHNLHPPAMFSQD